MRGEIATRLAGSRDLFGAAAAPSKGVNFIVAHDGFTLADLVSYARKHNEANGEQNRDGTDANYSWNHGVEGPSSDPAVVAARARDQRNLLTLLLASRGTPMLAMGSELGFTQGGNNNAYAHDNATTAIDWKRADAALTRFASRLVRARRDHPALSHDAFLTGEPFDATGLADVEWRDADGPMSQSGWNDPAGPVLVAVFAAPHDGGVDRVAVAMNRSARTWSSACRSRAPAWGGGRCWRRTPRMRPNGRSPSPTAASSRPAPHSSSPRVLRPAACAAVRRPPTRSTRSPPRSASPPTGGTSTASGRSSRPKAGSRS